MLQNLIQEAELCYSTDRMHNNAISSQVCSQGLSSVVRLNQCSWNYLENLVSVFTFTHNI